MKPTAMLAQTRTIIGNMKHQTRPFADVSIMMQCDKGSAEKNTRASQKKLSRGAL
jgi:uncharacterized lipoprotein YajG